MIRAFKKGVTLIELLITITVIAIGVFPLIGALANLVELLLMQQDQVSAITVGRNQMDLFLNQHQFIDRISPANFTAYPPELTLVAPGIRDRSLLSPNATSMDLEYNNAHFRTFSKITKIENLSTTSRVTYLIRMQVWKVGFPLPKEVSEDIPPEFRNGDNMLFELAALYTQSSRFEL